MPNNPYYVGPQSVSKNPVDYMQAAQMASQSYMMGQESNGEQTGGLINSGLQGAASGFQIGGPVGAAVGAGVGALSYGLGQVAGQNKMVRDADVSADLYNQDMEGNVVYSGQQAQDTQRQISDLRKIADKPAIGNLLVNRKGAREKQRQLEQSFAREQEMFNLKNTQNQQQYLQRQQYQDRLNNVYNIPMGYF